MEEGQKYLYGVWNGKGAQLVKKSRLQNCQRKLQNARMSPSAVSAVTKATHFRVARKRL